MIKIMEIIGSNLNTVKVNEEGKDAINGIIGIVGPENALGVITGIGTSNGNANVDNVVKNANVTDKEKEEIQKYLDILNGNGAGNYQKYPI